MRNRARTLRENAWKGRLEAAYAFAAARGRESSRGQENPIAPISEELRDGISRSPLSRNSDQATPDQEEESSDNY